MKDSFQSAKVYGPYPDRPASQRFKALVRIDRKPLVSWGKTKDEAIDKLTAKRQERVEGTPVVDNRQTVGKLCLLWLQAIGETVPVGVTPANLSKPVAQAGIDTYSATLHRNVLARPVNQATGEDSPGTPLGDRLLTSLKIEHFVQLLDDMRACGLSTSIRQNLRGRLIQVMKYGVILEWSGALEALSMVQATARAKTEAAMPASALTREDRDTLLEAASDSWIGNALVVLFYSGLRKGELLGLRWSDLDGGVIHVTGSLKRAGGKVVRGSVKTAKSKRDVPIHPAAAAAFERQHEVSGDCEYVFTTKAGGPINPETFSHAVQNLGRRVFPDKRIYVHQTRHSYVTLLREGGMEYDAIASLVGHKNGKITEDIYTHLVPASQNAAVVSQALNIL